MKTKLLSIIAVVLAMFVSPPVARAHDFEAVNQDGKTIYYKILSQTTCAITYKTDAQTTSAGAFDEYTDTIRVPATAVNPADGVERAVTNLGVSAFYNTSVRYISLPEGLTTIDGTITFADQLSYLSIPSTLTTITGGYLTTNLKGLETLVWNAANYINTTGSPLFSSTSTYTSYTGLRRIEFGKQVQMIPANFARNLYSLNTVVIPQNVMVIGADAFTNCDNLYEVYNLGQMPIAVGSSNQGNVARYAKVVHKSMDDESIFHYTPDWNLMLMDGVLTVLRYVGTPTQVVMPQQFTIGETEYRRYGIGGSAFYGGPASEKVTQLTLPDSLLFLNGSALYHTRVTSLTIPRTLERIGSGALPTTLISLTWNAIECESDGVINMWGDVTSGVVPSTVATLNMAQYIKQIPSAFLAKNNNIYLFAIPSSVERIGASAFNGCSSLTGTLTLPASLREIGDKAFYNCSGYYGILSLPEGLQKIGGEAFSGASNFTGMLTIPESVDSIGGKAFGGTNFSSVHFAAADCKTNGYELIFDNCQQITSFTFGDNVRTIPDYLCRNLSSIANTITLPNALERIGKYAFDNVGAGFSGIVTLPESLQSIAECGIKLDGVQQLTLLSHCLSLVAGRRESSFTGTFNGTIHIGTTVDSIPENLFNGNMLGAASHTIDSIFFDIPNYIHYPLREDWGNYIPTIFDNLKNKVTKIGIGDNVRTIPSRLFSTLNKVARVQIPEAVEAVGCDAFSPATDVVAQKPYGQIIKLKEASVSSWQDVFLYVETNDYYTYDKDGVSCDAPIKPFGERPGLLLTAPYNYTFPTSYCGGVKIQFSNGTDCSDLVLLPDASDTLYCSLMMQGGTDIPLMIGTEESVDLLPDPSAVTVILDEAGYEVSFYRSMGDFTEFVKMKPSSCPAVWTAPNNYDYVKATAYINNTNYATEVWLVSPTFDCSAVDYLYLAFDNTLGYTNNVTDITQYIVLKATTDGTTWTDIPISTYPSWGQGSQWWKWLLCRIDLTQYLSPTTRFAFVYRSDGLNAPTWEIRNLKLTTTEQSIPDVGFGEMQVPIVRSKKLADYFYDFNGDGTPDLDQCLMASSITNTAPTAPTAVKAVQDGGYVVLSWDDAYDAETPARAMRYNVSVRRVGATGEGSYVISPMNGGSDIAVPSPDVTYFTLTQMNIPASRFTVGESYEVKVQAIDGWNAHSPFSTPFTIEIASQVGINVPMEACTGVAVTATYSGTESGTPMWNSEGASIQTNGTSADFVWVTPGVKTIQCTVGGVTSTRAITVAEGVDLAFSLPQKVLSSAYVYFTLPEAFADSRNQVMVRNSLQAESQPVAPIIYLPFAGGSWICLPVVNSDRRTISVERRGTTLDARMQANVPDGQYWIEMVCYTEACGEITYRQSFIVDGDNVTPEISIVSVDAATGKNVVCWQEPDNLPNSDLYTSMVIFREEGATNNFVRLGETTISAGRFVDMASDPTMRKYRYRIALQTYYDGISTMSDVHSSVHLMLNRGLTAGSVNIVWTPYEGGIIQQYTILRGTSPDNLQTLTTTSGYEQSYTDFASPAGDVYYALSYTNTYDNGWGTIGTSSATAVNDAQFAPRAAVTDGRSNAVNANQSNTVTPATSLTIRYVEKTLMVSPSQTDVHLYTELLPGTATYKVVSWQVTSGQNLVSVSSTGLVQYTGDGSNGSVTIKATTVDGSNLSKSITIPVQGFITETEVTSVVLRTAQSTLSPSQTTTTVTASVYPADALNRSVVWSVSSGSDIVAVDQQGVVTALGVNGTAVIRATAQNGVFGELTIAAVGFGGGEDPNILATSFTLYATTSPESTTPVDPLITPDCRVLYIKADIYPLDATIKEFSLELLDYPAPVTVLNMGTYFVVREYDATDDMVLHFRGSTIDGSNLKQSFEIRIEGFTPVAVDEVVSASLVVYPQPANDILYLDSDYQLQTVRIVSSDGKVVYSTNSSVTAINVSTLPSGIYHLQATTTDGKVITRNIVIR